MHKDVRYDGTSPEGAVSISVVCTNFSSNSSSIFPITLCVLYGVTPQVAHDFSFRYFGRCLTFSIFVFALNCIIFCYTEWHGMVAFIPCLAGVSRLCRCIEVHVQWGTGWVYATTIIKCTAT